MKTNGIQKMHVKDIMRSHMPTYPGNGATWKDTLEIFFGSPSNTDIETLAKLGSTLRDEGTYREHILLESETYRDAARDYSSECDDNYPLLRVMNGTHRVLATLLAEHKKELPVRFLDAEEGLVPIETNSKRLVTMINLNGNHYLDKMGDIMERARSIEINKSLWITAHEVSIPDKKIRISWDFSSDNENVLADANTYSAISDYLKDYLQTENIDHTSINTFISL